PRAAPRSGPSSRGGLATAAAGRQRTARPPAPWPRRPRAAARRRPGYPPSGGFTRVPSKQGHLAPARRTAEGGRAVTGVVDAAVVVVGFAAPVEPEPRAGGGEQRRQRVGVAALTALAGVEARVVEPLAATRLPDAVEDLLGRQRHRRADPLVEDLRHRAGQ